MIFAKKVNKSKWILFHRKLNSENCFFSTFNCYKSKVLVYKKEMENIYFWNPQYYNHCYGGHYKVLMEENGPKIKPYKSQRSLLSMWLDMEFFCFKNIFQNFSLKLLPWKDFPTRSKLYTITQIPPIKNHAVTYLLSNLLPVEVFPWICLINSLNYWQLSIQPDQTEEVIVKHIWQLTQR